MGKQKQSQLAKRKADSNSSFWLNKADSLWSRRIRSIGSCEICGATNNLNAHHLYPREDLAIRHELSNGICLCAKHHKFSVTEPSAHGNSLAFVQWLQTHLSERLNILRQQKETRNNDRFSYKEICEALELLGG